MSKKLILPGHMAEEQKELARDSVVGDTPQEKDEKLASQLPTPKGFKVLIGLPKIEDTYESGIVKSDKVIRDDTVAAVIGFVIETGPEAYKDPVKFPSGPRCKKGDFILMRAYSGTRFKLHGVEFRLLDDDCIDAVVEDPRGYTRAA